MFKWTVKKAGVYNLSAFEPYAFRYANVITSAGVKANVKVRAYENSEAGKMLFECDDKKIEQIMEAARHTFATRALECGMDVKTLAEILGHKNATVTLNRYAHSLMEHKQDMMNKRGKIFN